MRRLLGRRGRDRSQSPRSRSRQQQDRHHASRSRSPRKKKADENDDDHLSSFADAKKDDAASPSSPGGWADYMQKKDPAHVAAMTLQRLSRGRRERQVIAQNRRHHTAKRFVGENPKHYCVVQWETADFYTYESEINGMPTPEGVIPPEFTIMIIGIARLGSSKGVAKCKYRTFDMSAFAGINYMAVPSTEAIFEDGETHKDIEIRVIPCESFDGTIEFGLYIEQDSGVNCAIGKYLHTATVKIIDLSSFPTNKLQRFVKGGDSKKIQSIPPIELIRSFLEMCWRIPEVREGSKKIIISEQFHSLYAIGLVFIMYSVVSTLTSSRSSGEKMDNLTLLAAGWIFPVCIKHYLDYAKQFWKVGGTMRSKLQLLLLKKFLNYTDDSRCHVEIETLLMAMVRDVSECVSEGYLAALDLFFGSGIKIGMLVLAMLILQVISTGTMVLEVETALPLIVVCCLPVPIFVFLTLRQANYFKLRDEVFKNENKGIDHVISSVLNYDLVSAYDKRTEQLMEYAKKLQTLNAAINSLNSSVVNSSYFVPWLIALIVGGYIWYGGYQVVQFEEENGTKGLELAQFLSTIGIIRALGEEFTTAYGQVLRITGAYCNIRAVTVFLNLPVDVPQRLQVSRQRRILGKQLRAELRESIRLGKVEPLSLHDVPADRMKIVMNDANFSYVDKGGFDEGDKEAQSSDTKTKNKKKPKNKKNSSIIPERRISAKIANMYMGISEIEQGKVVTIIGAKSQGKATIMRLIAGHLFPEVEDSNDSVYGRCSLFIPPHLRVVQVSENPIIFNLSVFKNLVYGIKPSPDLNWVAIKERARNIIRRLGLSPELVDEFFEVDSHVGSGGVRITRSDRQLISIGRALVMNPELIICHKPTALLDEKQTDAVMDMFREFVENRGVFMPSSEPLVRRRRRTIIYSAKGKKAAAKADVVFQVRSGKLVEIGNHGSREEFLSAIARAIQGKEPDPNRLREMMRLKEEATALKKKKRAKLESKLKSAEEGTTVGNNEDESSGDDDADSDDELSISSDDEDERDEESMLYDPHEDNDYGEDYFGTVL